MSDELDDKYILSLDCFKSLSEFRYYHIKIYFNYLIYRGLLNTFRKSYPTVIRELYKYIEKEVDCEPHIKYLYELYHKDPVIYLFI